MEVELGWRWAAYLGILVKISPPLDDYAEASWYIPDSLQHKQNEFYVCSSMAFLQKVWPSWMHHTYGSILCKMQAIDCAPACKKLVTLVLMSPICAEALLTQPGFCEKAVSYLC